MTTETLQDRINANYYNEDLDLEFRDEILSFVREHESIAHFGISFIKGLTKVASTIIEKDAGCLDGFLDRVFKYHIEGIKRIEDNTTGDVQKLDQRNAQILRSHLHSHAGNIMRLIGSKESDDNSRLSYLTDEYEHMKTAGEIISPITSNEAAVYFLVACKAARVGSKIAEEMHDSESVDYWINERLAMAEKALEAAKDKIISAEAEYHVGGAYFVLFTVKKNEDYARKAKEYYERFMITYKECPGKFDPKRFTIDYVASRIRQLNNIVMEEKPKTKLPVKMTRKSRRETFGKKKTWKTHTIRTKRYSRL